MADAAERVAFEARVHNGFICKSKRKNKSLFPNFLGDFYLLGYRNAACYLPALSR